MKPWHDSDDETLAVDISGQTMLKKLRSNETETVVSGPEYIARLRTQYTKLHPPPRWTETKEYDEVQVSQPWIGSGRIEPDVLDVRRRSDMGIGMGDSAVDSISFSEDMMIIGGGSRKIRMFRMDGNENPMVQSVSFSNSRISRAGFTADGKEVIVTGGQSVYHVYDLEQSAIYRVDGIRGTDERCLDKFCVSACNRLIGFLGRNGMVHLVDRTDKQWIESVKMNIDVQDIGFTADGRFMWSINSEHEVWKWDMATFRCVDQIRDQGALGGTSIAVSPNGEYVATGSRDGLVAVYSSKTGEKIRSLRNLSTSIDHMEFNHDSQLLAVSSRENRNSVRMVHIPSMRVYSNWPDQNLGHVTAVAFARNSRYVGVGNSQGNVCMYELGHYAG